MFNFPMTNFFPFLIISLSAWSSIVYFINKDIPHGVYWACAAVLNISVLMMGEV